MVRRQSSPCFLLLMRPRTIGLEYLADGVTENIINTLSQISKLRVMSRSTVFRYKGERSIQRLLAGELNVDAMLLGKTHFTTQWSDDQCRTR